MQKYPNRTFQLWRRDAVYELWTQCQPKEPITSPVAIVFDYWPSDKRTRDVSGMLDALFHLLVYSKILKDDGLIHDVIWRRHAMNRQFPKVVMEIDPWTRA